MSDNVVADLFFDHEKKEWVAIVNGKPYGVYDPYEIYTSGNTYDTYKATVQMYDGLDAVKVVG
jgi:hypothetical protein